MQAIVSALFQPSAFTPHGFCLLWEPGLLWLHALSDALIGLSYFSIPLALLTLVRKRPDFEFGWLLWLFAAFILACGTTHFLSILTLWEPFYWLEGAVKLVTAAVSVLTAILLWPLLPRALALPSPTSLRLVNEELSRQILERDRNATALLEREAQLRQAQKMEAVGRLTGGIAHDFNNMLTVVTGSLERARGRLGEGEEAVARLVDIAMSGATRAATLTHRLLAFSRQQPLAPAPVDANKLVSGMSDLLRRTLGENFMLETALAGEDLTIDVDANQLESALLNLAVNARDAMPGGGRLTIETGRASLDADYLAAHAADLAPGDYVLIAVTDTGTGMTREVAAQAFEPFFTTKEVGAGTGLGLSQVFGFVKQTGGNVGLYTELGRGTTIRMYFPAFAGKPSHAAIPKVAAAVPAGKGEAILLVEDDAAVRGFGAETLGELGYRVLQADSAAPALALLRGGERVDLLLTDVVLPGADGGELARKARLLRPGLPVLFASGYTGAAILHNGVLEPGVHLISKPFGAAQLAVAVRRALDRAPESSAA